MTTPAPLRMIFLGAASLLIPLSIPVSTFAAESKADGLWDAVVVVNKVEVPFRFEIGHNGKQVQGFFFEGDKKIGSTSGSLENGALKLDYDFLNTTLEATIDGDQLKGTYHNRRPNARPMEIRAHKFVPVPEGKTEAPKVAGNWDMKRTSMDRSKLDVSWKLFIRQSGSAVSGAILKTSGDSGQLTGSWKDGKLIMSHFSGDRPLYFEGELNKDGTLTITLDTQFHYRAARTSEARAQGIPEPPDPSKFTSVKDPTERFHFSGFDLEGKTITEADPRFQGKVMILTIGGSWCPNCHDEAPFLVELYKQYRAKGLEIVGLNFEQETDLAEVKPRLNAFIKRYGITFPMIVPGTPDNAAEKLSQLVNFGVYPTTVILGRDGRVRSVHAGFASVATGEEHVRLTREERELVEQLLAERVPQGQRVSGGF